MANIDLERNVSSKELGDFREHPIKNTLKLMTPIYGEYFLNKRLNERGTSTGEKLFLGGTYMFAKYATLASLGLAIYQIVDKSLSN
jgi:hypothetical protein